MKKIISKNSNMSVFLDEDGLSIFAPGQVLYSYAFDSANADKETGIQGFKLGDTHVGPSKRVGQWRQVPVYYDAILRWSKPNIFYFNDNIPVMFRDYNVHKALERIYGIERMKNIAIVQGLSDEHFAYAYNNDDQLIEVCEAAHYDVIEQFANPRSPYKYITMDNKKLLSRSYERVFDFPARKFQQDSIDHMLQYFKSTQGGQYLYSAPTRAGKTFTNLLFVKQLTDELGLEKSVTLAVSAKADVIDEWKQGCESHMAFEKFTFLTKEHFANEPTIVQQSLDKNKHVIVFFTLQDLYGSNKGEGIKEAHEFLKDCTVDIILSDEAHYAGFTEHGKLNKVVNSTGIDLDRDDINALVGLETREERKINRLASKEIGNIEPRLGKVFITATPYNILFDEYYNFTDNNMTIITQKDIQNEDAKWQKENVDNGDKQPWQSPYFGIPKKYHFVIPTSIPPEDVFKLTNEGKFVNETYLSEFLSDMFGVTEHRNAPNIFTDEVYKEARLGNNIMFTVGQRSAADHLYEILHDVLSAELLEKYEIVTISSKKGLSLSNKTIEEIKQYIDDSEKKIILITCDRALTGVTMKKIDTMVFMRNMKSAQQFIQAAGRSASPWVVDMKDEDGNTIKHCMKENSAVISFDPYQAVNVIRAEIAYEAEHSKANGAEVEELIGNHLESNPIYMLDENLVRLHEMNSLDIMSIARDYNSDKALGDLIPDYGFKIDLKNAEVLSILDQTTALSNNKSIKPIQLFEESINNLGFCYVKDCDEKALEGSEYCAKHLVAVSNPLEYVDNIITLSDDEIAVKEAKKRRKELLESLLEYKKKVRNIANLCLIYAVLNRDETIKSMNQLIDSINDPKNDELVNLLGINKDNLEFLHRSGTFNIHVDFALSEIEWRFTQPYDRVFDQYKIIFNTVKRLSASEVVTPSNVVDLMLDKIDLSNGLKNGIIDNGCKSGVFLVGAYDRLLDCDYKHEDICNKIFSIPTSGLTFVIIRDMYQQLGWRVENILFVEDVSCLEMNEYLADYANGGSRWRENSKVKSLFEEAFKQVTPSTIVSTDTSDDKTSNSDATIDSDASHNVDTNNVECLFDYCISNPPYQREVSINQSPPIYHHFISSAQCFAHESMYIVKDNWVKAMNDKNNKLQQWREEMIKNRKITYLKFMGTSAFPAVSVSTVIVKTTSGKSDTMTIDDVMLDKYPDWRIPIFTNEQYRIISKIFHNDKNMQNAVINFRMFGTNRQSFREAVKNNIPTGDIKVLTFVNKKRDFIFALSDKLVKKDCLPIVENNFKLAFADLRLWQQNENNCYYLLGENEIAGEGFSMLVFNTKEERENYIKYINSNFWVYAVKLSIGNKEDRYGNMLFVPDLGDYTSNNPDINWDEPLDPQLYKLFNLTEEEIKIIEKDNKQ